VTATQKRLVIHPTQDKLYQQCPRKFYLSVVERLVPKEPVPALAVGTLGHKALERYYRDGVNPASAFAEAYNEWVGTLEVEVPESVEQQAESVHRLLSEYPQWAEERDRWVVWFVEQKFEVPVGTVADYEVVLRGRFDLVVHFDGRLWVVDHKFLSRFTPVRVMYLDTQFTHYALAMNLLWPDELVGGVIPNLIHKYYPKSRSTPLFDRHPLYKTRNELIHARQHLLRRVRRIVEDLQEGVWTPNPGPMCGTCSYYDLCREMELGGDVGLLIELRYKRSEDEDHDFGFEED